MILIDYQYLPHTSWSVMVIGGILPGMVDCICMHYMDG